MWTFTKLISDSLARPFEVGRHSTPSGISVFVSMNNGTRISTRLPRLCLIFAVNVLCNYQPSVSPDHKMDDSREPSMWIGQQLSYILTSTRARLVIRRGGRIGERSINDSKARPGSKGDWQLVRMEVRADDLSSETHIALDGDQIARRARKRRTRGGLEHIATVFWMECRYCRARPQTPPQLRLG